jgi:hypothetical protein
VTCTWLGGGLCLSAAAAWEACASDAAVPAGAAASRAAAAPGHGGTSRGRRVVGPGLQCIPLSPPPPGGSATVMRRVQLDSVAASMWSSWRAWAVLPAGVTGGGGGRHLQIRRRPG